ncbi:MULTISPECIES: hypothetical protein [unclassified Streptomyces]|uniref:hypothetical protein n=1 Tax=unclassified Streptomyces TaxID=2593676 RepID=UPI0036A40B78
MPHRPHTSVPSPLWQARRQALRLDRAFLTANAVGLAVTLGLGATAGDLLAHRLPGTQATVGLLLYFAQAALLLVTALRFDRRCTRLLDPWQQAYTRSGAGAADSGTGTAK